MKIVDTKSKLAAAVSIAAMITSGQVFADAPGSFADAVKNGTTKLSFRYRYENVDDDSRAEEADASTLRSRLTYTTQTYKHWQAQVEVDDITIIGGENYDDFHNDKTDHAVVADYEGTEVNQAWVSYNGFDKTVLKAGRQRINLDNQRFVGGVGWRQNEQTYDGFTLVNNSLQDTTVFAAYIDNVNRIFGPDEGRAGTPAADVDLDSSIKLLNINYKGSDLAKISVYGYWLDIEDAAASSSKTFGIRLDGSRGEDTKLLYTLEYARQSDYGDNPANYDADYYLAEAGVQAGGITARIGREVLGSDDGEKAFQTPLATLHKFQGFADQFLSTPDNGIEDDYVSVFTTLAGVKLGAIYHEFSADEGSDDYGKEWDLVAAKQLSDNLHLLLKYADFSEKDGYKADKQIAWAQLTVTF